MRSAGDLQDTCVSHACTRSKVGLCGEAHPEIGQEGFVARGNASGKNDLTRKPDIRGAEE